MKRPRPSRRPARRGKAFTVVEVLATLVLAGIVLPPVMHGVLLCLATSGHARGQVQAASLAQSKLAEIVATGQWDDAQANGDFGEDFPEYTWESQVDEWEDSRLVQVDVAVMWTRRGIQRQVGLSTLVYTGVPNE